MDAIDLFAGAGGLTVGARQAGCRVVWAANHWPVAVKVHAANHPKTQHVTQDLQQADWSQVPRHQLLLGAPCCQGHANARGAERPHHDRQRSTAWAIVSAAEYHKPDVGLVENVPEFQQWALYPAWISALNALGYAVSPHIVDAADHGVPQHRVRLFLVLTRSRAPLVLTLPKQPHVPASTILDFDAGRWKPVYRPGRAAATIARYEAGRAAHGNRFLLTYYGSARGGRSINRPLGTITTSANHHALVDGDRMRMPTVAELRAGMGFPADYQLPVQRTVAANLLGNAVCPRVAKKLITELCRSA